MYQFVRICKSKFVSGSGYFLITHLTSTDMSLDIFCLQITCRLKGSLCLHLQFLTCFTRSEEEALES